jgi:hypothetical protein
VAAHGPARANMGLVAMLDTGGSGCCSGFMRWWLVAGAASLG